MKTLDQIALKQNEIQAIVTLKETLQQQYPRVDFI